MNYYSAIFINMTQLNKIIKSVLDEQVTISDAGKAKQIYNAKGLVWDNEYAALKAILAIKDINQFNSVQKELQKLTGGRGIGQYVSEFIQVRDSANSLYAPTTIRYIKSIISHLTKIGAYKQTIDIFTEKLKQMEKWSRINADLASSGAGQTQFAWETFAQRAAVDPEFKHNYLTSLQILASFIPVVGWAVSAGIGLGNAYVYYQEGDTKQAGLEAIFAAIPGLGIAGNIGLGKVAPKLMGGLGKKVALNQTKNLTKQEIRILDLIGKNQKGLKKELDNYFKTSIAKNAKQISKDKLKAAGKKYGLGLAKTSGTLGSYMTIAQLYGSAYDANAEQITDKELLALNNKLDADFERWLATRYKGKVADATIPDSNNNSLNEAPAFIPGPSGMEIASGLGPMGWTIAGLAGATVLYTFKKFLNKIGIKYATPKFYRVLRAKLRDRKFFKELGVKNADEVRALYKDPALLKSYQETWLETEAKVKVGLMTPKDAMRELDFLATPGTARTIYDNLDVLYNKAAKKIKSTGTASFASKVDDIPKPTRPDTYGMTDAKAAAAKKKYATDYARWKRETAKTPVITKLRQDADYAKWLDMHSSHVTATNILKGLAADKRNKYKALIGALSAIGGLAGYLAWDAYKVYQHNKQVDAQGAMATYKKMLDYIKNGMKKPVVPVVKKKVETPKVVDTIKKKTPVVTPITPPIAPEEFELPD